MSITTGAAVPLMSVRVYTSPSLEATRSVPVLPHLGPVESVTVGPPEYGVQRYSAVSGCQPVLVSIPVRPALSSFESSGRSSGACSSAASCAVTAATAGAAARTGAVRPRWSARGRRRRRVADRWG
ncbi:hypothetical protein [Streptomyces sp. E-08]|uniref:hypothetical protein n=1 Tax=Streptomyces sp. E-08 TaxID=3404047 RepID=UPI003CF36012